MKNERKLQISQSVRESYLMKTFSQQNLAGVLYQVYPVVLIVEGVHHGMGSDPVYYSSPVIQASVPSWNNVPITVPHPTNPQGQHVLVMDDPAIRGQFQVGHIANARFENGKLVAEAWLNVSLTNQLQPNLLTFIENGGKLEVSTGMLALDDGVAGTWNEEAYAASILDMVPDHLALLPNSTGACSWNDGCGLRANENVVKGREEKPKVLIIVGNEQNLGTLVDQIYRLVDSFDVYDPAQERNRVINYCRAVFETYFVYKQVIRRQNSPEIQMLLKQDYKIAADGSVELVGDPAEVTEEVSYQPKANEGQIANNNTTTKEVSTMADVKKCCEARIKALIASGKTIFKEADQEWLMSLNEDQFGKIEALATAEPPKETQTKETVGPVTLESYLADAPPEIRTILNAGLKEYDNKRADIIGKIMKNAANKFTEGQLKDMDTVVLESIIALIPAVNYSGQAPAPTQINNGEGEKPYVPVTLSDRLFKQPEQKQ